MKFLLVTITAENSIIKIVHKFTIREVPIMACSLVLHLELDRIVQRNPDPIPQKAPKKGQVEFAIVRLLN